jgi:hypothetical protein
MKKILSKLNSKNNKKIFFKNDIISVTFYPKLSKNYKLQVTQKNHF